MHVPLPLPNLHAHTHTHTHTLLYTHSTHFERPLSIGSDSLIYIKATEYVNSTPSSVAACYSMQLGTYVLGIVTILSFYHHHILRRTTRVALIDSKWCFWKEDLQCVCVCVLCCVVRGTCVVWQLPAIVARALRACVDPTSSYVITVYRSRSSE